MTKIFPRFFLVVFIIAAFGMAFSAQADATADVIAKAKIDRVIGERTDGYIGVINGTASADIERAVRETNIKRKAVYGDLARARNATIEVIAALTGEKLITRTPKGQMVMDANGNWRAVP